jgi:GntR family transcriptional regulator
LKVVDRSAPVPLYYQLKQIILAEIIGKKLSPGDRIPGDVQLCATYGVSRTVVRQALFELEAAGVIDRINGRGTFVAQPKTAEGLAQSLTGLHEDVALRGGTLVSQVRTLAVVPADVRVAEILEIDHEAPVIELERLRFVDGSPWALTITHVPYELAPGLLEEDMRDQSLYGLLEGKYGVPLKRGRRSIGATTADVALARDLQVPRGAAILVLNSVSFGANGRPVEEFVAYHRGDRSRFDVVLNRQPVPSPSPLVVVKSKTTG